MKHTFILLALLAFAFGCKSNDPDYLPQDAIELDNATWEYSQKSALVRFAGTPAHRDIYIKIDGEDGANLYLILPQQNLDSIPSMPYEINGRAAYYSNSIIPTDYAPEGPATIQLLGIDANTQQLRLSFEAVVIGQDGVEKHFKSGEISAISFKEVNAFASFIDYEIKKDQEVWSINERDAHMHYGEVNWFLYNTVAFPEASGFYLRIPWGQPLGTFQIAPTNMFPITFEKGVKRWILESAEITLEENSFQDAKQKGRFKGIFHHPNFPDQKFEVTDGRFEVNY